MLNVFTLGQTAEHLLFDKNRGRAKVTLISSEEKH